MAKSEISPVDWPAIEKDLEDARSTCYPFKIATIEEIELEKLSQMTYGKIPSEFYRHWNSGDLIVVHDEEKRQRLESMVDFFGFPENNEIELLDHKDGILTIWGRLKDGIVQRKMTAAFIQDWSLLQFSLGSYMELYRGNEDEYKMKFRQCMMAMSDNTLIQKHWYANWLLVNTPNAKGSKDFNDARQSLAGLIQDINKKRVHPRKPYPGEWYVKMLETDQPAGDSKIRIGDQLKSPYTKLSIAEIRRMAEHPLITTKVLPPLSVNQFKRM